MNYLQLWLSVDQTLFGRQLRQLHSAASVGPEYHPGTFAGTDNVSNQSERLSALIHEVQF